MRHSLIFIALTCFSGVAHGYVANLTTDFTSNSSNPDGVWTHGYFPTTAGVGFTVFSIATSGPSGFGWEAPQSSSQLGTPGMWKNTGTTTLYGVAPGEVSLHPGPSEIISSRFTVPASWGNGVATISATFGVGDTGAVQGLVLINGSSVYGQSVTSTPQSFNLSNVVLGPGQTVDFAVANLDGYFSDNTPVSATINFTPVPEPASVLALSAGALALVRRRKSA